MSKWIKKGDRIVAIAGNEKGNTGTVLSKKGDRVIVEGLNVRKKHYKPKREGERGGIFPMEAPIHVSNIAIADNEGRPVKLKVRSTESGKELFYERDGNAVVHRIVRKKK